MKEAEKSRLKIFLWDQLVRPIYLLLNIHQLQALLLALLIINFVVWQNMSMFWVLVISLIIIFSYQIYKYYQSGEFINNYRKYKSEKGEYRDYRKLTKVLKKEKEEKAKPISQNDISKSISEFIELTNNQEQMEEQVGSVKN